MKPDVVIALDEIRATFPDATVMALINPDGGAYVTVDKVHLGDQWSPAYSPISFTISFQYPYADCYPHFVDASLARKDGSPLGEAIHANNKTPDEKTAVMISRRNNRASDVPDTAAEKLVKVLDWMRSR